MELEHVPDDVGRMGKEKAKSRLGKIHRDRAAADDDDQEDWFSRARNNKPPDNNGKKSGSTPTKPKGKSFNFSDSLRDRLTFQPATGGGSGEPPSLLSRLGDNYYKPGHSNQKDKSYQGDDSNPSGSSSNPRRKKDRRDRQRSPERALDEYRIKGKGDSGRRRDYRDDDRGRDRRDYGRQDRDRSYSGHGGGGGGGSNSSRYRGSYYRD
jgi:hypothetical protein